MTAPKTPTRLLLAAALSCTAGLATAGPQATGATDGVSFDNPSADVTNITAPDNAIIDYSNFDVGSNETVNFIQPDAGSRVLNRIHSNSPTQINGRVNANGIVYFVNPAGVTFGPGSVVDTAGLYAAAGSLSNEDFLSRNDNFTGLTGDVAQHGMVRADVIAAFVGKNVTNTGHIAVPNGSVVLASGDNVYIGSPLGGLMVQVESDPLSPEGSVTQEGTIDAERTELVSGDLASLAMRSPDNLASESQPTDPTSIEQIDTDGDGDVDMDDINTAIANLTGNMPGAGKTQAQGDVDGDGDVDNIDIGFMILFFTGPITPGDPGVAGPFDLADADALDGPPAVEREVLLAEAGLEALLSQLGITPRPLLASERLSKAQARGLYNDLQAQADAAPPDQRTSIQVAKTRLDPDVVRQLLQVYQQRIAVEGVPADERIAQIRVAVNAAYQQYTADGRAFEPQGFAEAVRTANPDLFDDLSAMDRLRRLAMNLGLNEAEKTIANRQIIRSTQPEGLSFEQMQATLIAAGTLAGTTATASVEPG